MLKPQYLFSPFPVPSPPLPYSTPNPDPPKKQPPQSEAPHLPRHHHRAQEARDRGAEHIHRETRRQPRNAARNGRRQGTWRNYFTPEGGRKEGEGVHRRGRGEGGIVLVGIAISYAL